jgi:hypothetical protein
VRKKVTKNERRMFDWTLCTCVVGVVNALQGLQRFMRAYVSIYIYMFIYIYIGLQAPQAFFLSQR